MDPEQPAERKLVFYRLIGRRDETGGGGGKRDLYFNQFRRYLGAAAERAKCNSHRLVGEWSDTGRGGISRHWWNLRFD